MLSSTVFRISFILFVLIGSQTAYSQIYLQLEKFNSPKTIKFVEGDWLEFRVHEYPKVWRAGRLTQLLLEEQTIVLDGDFFQLDELKDIRVYRPWARRIGTSFIQFAGAWYLYAVIIDGFNLSDFEIGTDTVLIGAGSFGLGMLIRNIFGKKKYKLGKNSRLRFVDLRF